MPYTVSTHNIEDLVAEADAKNEIMLLTKRNTELHITAKEDKTVIWLPFGNEFEVIDGRIVIYEKP